MTDALTDAERTAVGLAGALYDLIVSEVIGDGPTRDADCAELAVLIHGVQRMVMSQAAGRAYPNDFRLLGESLREPNPKPPIRPKPNTPPEMVRRGGW